jgi:hypothetical protein
LNFLLCHSFVPNQEGKMAAAEPDDETAMGSQVLGPEKSQVLSILGPGLITGASDDDPSGIATYSQVGAQFGFQHFLDDAVQLSIDGGHSRDQRQDRAYDRARSCR